MATDGSNSKDFFYAEMLNMMREQGKKDNPTTLQLGIMLSENSVKIGDLTLNPEDLYIAKHLLKDYGRTYTVEVPYVSDASLSVKTGNYDVKDVTITLTKQDTIEIESTDGLKKGDLVAVMQLNDTNKFVILEKVVSVK